MSKVTDQNFSTIFQRKNKQLCELVATNNMLWTSIDQLAKDDNIKLDIVLSGRVEDMRRWMTNRILQVQALTSTIS